MDYGVVTTEQDLFRRVTEEPGATMRAIYTGDAPDRMEKTAAHRNPNHLDGTTYDDVHAEYETLVAMHDIDPGYVPEPHGRTADGYVLSVEPVIPAKEVLWPRPELRGLDLPDVDPDRAGQELSGALDRYHAHDVAHGDITLQNVVFDRDGSPGFIDPAGVSPDDPALDRIKQQDRDALADIFDSFR